MATMLAKYCTSGKQLLLAATLRAGRHAGSARLLAASLQLARKSDCCMPADLCHQPLVIQGPARVVTGPQDVLGSCWVADHEEAGYRACTQTEKGVSHLWLPVCP